MAREVELQVIPGTTNGIKVFTVRQILENDDGTQTAVVIMDEQTNLSSVLAFLSTRLTPQLMGGNQITVQLG